MFFFLIVFVVRPMISLVASTLSSGVLLSGTVMPFVAPPTDKGILPPGLSTAVRDTPILQADTEDLPAQRRPRKRRAMRRHRTSVVYEIQCGAALRQRWLQPTYACHVPHHVQALAISQGRAYSRRILVQHLLYSRTHGFRFLFKYDRLACENRQRSRGVVERSPLY